MEDVVGPSAASAAARGLVDGDFWRGRRVLVSGHTGFIGGWTTAWLHALGSDVTGFALPPPTSPSFHDLTKLDTRICSLIADIRSEQALARAFDSAQPDIVLHLAAQPLVRIGYEQPLETFAVNVMGTANVLEQVRRRGAQAVVVMSSDKVYGVRESKAPYSEDDQLGATDPYGGSKACCELVTAAYGRSYLSLAGIGLAIVRAGNVIGGGDWGLDRLLPDAVRAFSTGRPLVLRHPKAVRPWQHVLDAVSGLLVVAQEAAKRRTDIGPWNIGPKSDEKVSVAKLVETFASAWEGKTEVAIAEQTGYPETHLLALDAARANRELGISSPWNLDESISRTAAWYKRALAGEDAWTFTMEQIKIYQADKSGR